MAVYFTKFSNDNSSFWSTFILCYKKRCNSLNLVQKSYVSVGFYLKFQVLSLCQFCICKDVVESIYLLEKSQMGGYVVSLASSFPAISM